MNKQLLEVNGYNIDKIIQDSLFEKPTMLDGVGELYPIYIKDYEEFNNKYMKYIIINHEQLNLNYDSSIIDALILMGSFEKQSKSIEKDVTCNGAFSSTIINDPLAMMEKENKNDKVEDILNISEESLLDTINEMCDMLHYLFKKKVTFSENFLGFNIWTNDNISMPLAEKEYRILREIVMIQNGIAEQKVYKDKIIEEWVAKAKKARRKKEIKFNDLIIFVKNKSSLSYKDIMNMNLLQFYCDYYHYIHESDYDTSILFKTVSDKVPNVDLLDDITTKLYDNSDDDLFVDMNEITNMLD